MSPLFSSEDVRQKDWASPGNRIIRDNYFKIQRAREEIERLNIEIRRVVTYMADETDFLHGMEAIVARENQELAHQISCYRMERERSFSVHQACFAKLFKHPKFTGTSTPGQSVHLPPSMGRRGSAAGMPGDSDDSDGGNDDEYEDVEENEDDVADLAYKVLSVALDGSCDAEFMDIEA